MEQCLSCDGTDIAPAETREQQAGVGNDRGELIGVGQIVQYRRECNTCGENRGSMLATVIVEDGPRWLQSRWREKMKARLSLEGRRIASVVDHPHIGKVHLLVVEVDSR